MSGPPKAFRERERERTRRRRRKNEEEEEREREEEERERGGRGERTKVTEKTQKTLEIKTFPAFVEGGDEGAYTETRKLSCHKNKKKLGQHRGREEGGDRKKEHDSNYVQKEKKEKKKNLSPQKFIPTPMKLSLFLSQVNASCDGEATPAPDRR